MVTISHSCPLPVIHNVLLVPAARPPTMPRPRDGRVRSRSRARSPSAASHPFPPAPEVEAEVLIHPEDADAILPHRHDAQGICEVNANDTGESRGEDGAVVDEARPWWKTPSAWW